MLVPVLGSSTVPQLQFPLRKILQELTKDFAISYVILQYRTILVEVFTEVFRKYQIRFNFYLMICLDFYKTFLKQVKTRG